MYVFIKKYGRLQEVIEHADNPFLFFQIYHEISSKKENKLPKFSDASIEYIMKLYEKYTK